MRTEVERAWAAGFYDGEGCTSVCKRRRKDGTIYYSLKITIRQVDRQVLDKFAHIMGFNNVSGPYVPPKNKGKQQPYHTYTASGRSARWVIDILWPYLGDAKRNQYLKCITTISEET